MATNLPAVTPVVKGGFWGDLGSSSLTLARNAPYIRKLAQILDRGSARKLREIMITLTGATAGSAASATHKQIKAAEEGGTIDSEWGGALGKRTIETITDISANTDSADTTYLNAQIFAYPLAPSTYASNKDGNPRGYPGG